MVLVSLYQPPMTFEEKPSETVWNRTFSEQGRGLFMIAVGFVFLLFVFLRERFGHSHYHGLTVFLSSRSWGMLVVSPLFFSMGLAYLALGSRTLPLLGRPKRPTALGWTLYIVSLAIGVGFAWWVDHHHLTALGR
jgi:hypothetical protein